MEKTKRKISPYAMITFALAAIILTIFLSTKSNNSCDTVKTLLTSVKIKPHEGRAYLGFNINKQNLTFGTLNPGTSSKKTVFTEYTKNATTYVWVEGNFSSWVIISPKKFEIEPNQQKEVTFTLFAPVTAKPGEYEGKVIFCYQDK